MVPQNKVVTAVAVIAMTLLVVSAAHNVPDSAPDSVELAREGESTFRTYIKELFTKVARKEPKEIKKGLAWDQLKQKLDSGDVILFSGSAVMPSLLTRIMTHSFFTHLGMVVRMPDGELYLWQSVPEKMRDEMHKYYPEVKQYHSGAALIPLKEAIWDYNKEEDNEDARVFVRFLDGIDRKSAKFQDDLKNALINFSEKPFPKTWIPGVVYPMANALGMLESNILGKFHIHVEETYFCSQLIAATYEALGVLELEHVTNYYQPGDFSPEKTLVLDNGASFTSYIVEFDVKSPMPPHGEGDVDRKSVVRGDRWATVREMYARHEESVV